MYALPPEVAGKARLLVDVSSTTDLGLRHANPKLGPTRTLSPFVPATFTLGVAGWLAPSTTNSLPRSLRRARRG